MKILLSLLLLLFFFRGVQPLTAGDGKTLVCTTYPIRLLTETVADGLDSVRIELLVPAGTGCPHDYVLTATDMRLLMRADAVILNGLGLDGFVRNSLKSVQTDAVLIDSSVAIGEHLPSRIPSVAHRHDQAGEGEHEHQHDTGQRAVNPHLFVSPRLAARLVIYIAEQLSEMDPDHADVYKANAREAADRLQNLSREMAAAARDFERRRIVAQHDVFDYLARDLGLDVVAVIQGRHGHEPTATELRRLIRIVRDLEVAAVIAEPQYRENVPALLAAETGVPLVTLDPVAGGPVDGDLAYYETVMRSNLRLLQRLLQ